jgi:hypothetical protein
MDSARSSKQHGPQQREDLCHLDPKPRSLLDLSGSVVGTASKGRLWARSSANGPAAGTSEGLAPPRIRPAAVLFCNPGKRSNVRVLCEHADNGRVGAEERQVQRVEREAEERACGVAFNSADVVALARGLSRVHDVAKLPRSYQASLGGNLRRLFGGRVGNSDQTGKEDAEDVQGACSKF